MVEDTYVSWDWAHTRRIQCVSVGQGSVLALSDIMSQPSVGNKMVNHVGELDYTMPCALLKAVSIVKNCQWQNIINIKSRQMEIRSDQMCLSCTELCVRRHFWVIFVPLIGWGGKHSACLKIYMKLGSLAWVGLALPHHTWATQTHHTKPHSCPKKREDCGKKEPLFQ